MTTILLAVLAIAASPDSPQPPDSPCEQTCEPWEGFNEVRVGVVAGLIQPILLQGGNVEVDVYYRRFVFGYSHGFQLQLDGDAVVGAARDQGLAFRLPFTTGVGIGYRFLEWLDVRLEGKVHRFEVRDEASNQDLFAYTTVTLGVGTYAQYRPFYHFGVDAADWLQGIVIITSLRFWPRIWTSLDDDEKVYDNVLTGQEERHQAAEIGIANTPFIFNVGVGYIFTF